MDNLKAMNMFLTLGKLTNQEESRENQLKYQERIVFATMKASIPEWEIPEGWYELTIEEREKRIELLQKI
tara:strand:- start:975 stop:1184 length:210 start_codon:yes stop_codon:yes gene_type:complete